MIKPFFFFKIKFIIQINKKLPDAGCGPWNTLPNIVPFPVPNSPSKSDGGNAGSNPEFFNSGCALFGGVTPKYSVDCSEVEVVFVVSIEESVSAIIFVVTLKLQYLYEIQEVNSDYRN